MIQINFKKIVLNAEPHLFFFRVQNIGQPCPACHWPDRSRGPWFSNFSWSWSDPVRRFKFLWSWFGPGQTGFDPWIPAPTPHPPNQCPLTPSVIFFECAWKRLIESWFLCIQNIWFFWLNGNIISVSPADKSQNGQWTSFNFPSFSIFTKFDEISLRYETLYHISLAISYGPYCS